MLRTKKKQLNLKPNRQLDKRSSRGMLYENEELRLRTIHINDEVDKGQTDIKKLRKENEYLKREIWSLRDECSKLEDVLKKVYSGNPPPLSELPTYQPRVRKQSTFSGMWGGGRRGSNMSFSNCSSYDYEIENDTDNLNQENENDPDMINNYELGQGQALISGDQDSLEHSKKPASRQNSSQQVVQQQETGGLTTHVNWEDQQEVHQVEVYLVPGQQSDDNGDAHSLGFENIENQQQQEDYCLNQHVVLTHQNQHHSHNHNNHNLWQMHSPDLEAVTEESENASNSNNSNSNSNPAMVHNNNIPNYQPDISVSNSNLSNNNFGQIVSNGSVVGGNNFICIDHIDMDHTNSDNDSALFEALAFESMNCSLERIDNYNPIMDHRSFPVPCVTNNNGFLNLEPIPVRASSSNSTCNNNNNYFRPIIEITPARSSPTSTTASSGNGVGGRSSTATPPSKQFPTQNVDEREREERERSNSSASATGSGSGNGGGDPGLSNNNNSANTNSNQNQNQDHHLHHQTYPGSISASAGAGADFRDDVYHNLGCVTEIPKKYQVTSELKINVSRTNSSSSLVEQISSASSVPGLPDDGHTNSGSGTGGSVGCFSAGASVADNNKKADQVSSSGAQPQQEQLRYHPVLNKPSNCSTISDGTVTTITSRSANTGDESYRLSQVRQNQFTTHNQTSVFYNHDRERDLAEAETNNPVATKNSINNNSSGSGTGSGSGSGGASYRVLKIYSTYLSKTQQKTKRRPSSSSCSNNNNADSQSFSQSEPNLNSQDIFQFGTSSQPPPFGHRHGYEDEGPMSDIEVGVGGGWGPRNGQLTCRKLQGWSRSCCHTNSVVCSCHTNSRANLNPFEMCSCNCASENPHINLKDDWNVFDRNIVIGLLMDEGKDRDNKEILSTTSTSPPVSFRYLSVQEVIDELESQFDSTLENTQGVRLLTLPDFHPCRIFISVRNAGSVRTLIERGLTVRGQRMRLIDASQNAFSFIILSGLPSSFPDSSIISVLNEFGQVVAPLQRRVYKGVDTTERIARMHLVRIPPTSQIPLNIAGYEVLAKFVSQSQNLPSHEIPMSSSSVLSTANDMISTHAVLTCTSSGGSNAGDTGISTTVGSGSASAATATALGATPVPAGMNSVHKNYNSSLPTPTTVESGPGPGVIIQRGNKSPVPPALAIGPHGAGPVPVPGPGSASPTISSIPRPHKPVTRSTTLDSALATSTGHPGGSSLQLQNNFQVQPSTNTNSRFGLGPTAAAISKRNMSICGSLLDCPAASSTTAENGNGQKNGLLGNPKKPLSRLLRSSPGSLVPPSPGPGSGPGGGGMQLLGGDGSGLIAGGAGAGAGRPLSRSMSFEPRRPSGNGKALAVGSQLSLVDSHKLNNQGGSTGNFPLNDSIGSGNGLSRQQSRIFQQHRKLSQASSAHFRNSIDKTKEELPWCGCWGNGCI